MSTQVVRKREYRAYPQKVAGSADAFDNQPTREKIARPIYSAPKRKEWR